MTEIQVFEGKDEIPSDLQQVFNSVRRLELEVMSLRERLAEEMRARQQAETKLWQIQSILGSNFQEEIYPTNREEYEGASA